LTCFVCTGLLAISVTVLGAAIVVYGQVMNADMAEGSKQTRDVDETVRRCYDRRVDKVFWRSTLL
jgi:hypothetical protein